MLAGSWGFGQVPDLAPCGPTGGLGAILAFELARSPAEVAALFGDDPCRTRLATAQARALWIDALVFIPAYAAFLAFVAHALRERAVAIARLTIGAVLLAALLDQVEGVLLAVTLGELPGRRALLDPLYWIVRGKFVLLAAVDLALGWMLVRGRWPERIAAVAMLGGGLLSGWLIAVNAHSPALMEGHRIAWTALLALAALRTALPRPDVSQV